MNLNRVYEITKYLEEDGHMDCKKDMKEFADMYMKLTHIREVLNEKTTASNLKISKIELIVNGGKDDVSGFVC